MKNIIKKHSKKFKLLIGVIIGVAISGTAVYVYAAAASEYKYTNNSQTTVNGALNTLFTRTASYPTSTIYQNLVCPGCVYRKSTTQKYNVNSSSSLKTEANSKLSSGEYTTDYKTLNSNYFLGHVINSSGYILASYACGITNGTFFCLRGVDSDQISLTHKPFYQEAVNIMNKAFPSCNATTSSALAYCGGGRVYATALIGGNVYVNADTERCFVRDGGSSGCDKR